MTGLKQRHKRARTLAVLNASLLFTGLCLAQSQTVQPQETGLSLTLDPAKSSIHWIVDSTLHTVHGTFSIKSGAIRFDPQSKTGAAEGEIVVSAASGASGNGSRDGRMHKEILETGKYPDAMLHIKQIEGKVAPSGASDVKLHGTLSLHGSDHEITSPVHVAITGNQWNGTGQFEIPYVQWGIKDPSNFLLKVKPVVKVEVQLSGTIKSGTIKSEGIKLEPTDPAK